MNTPPIINDISYRNAIKVPDNAIPFHKTGFVSTVPTGTTITLLRFNVPNNVKGRRLSGIVYSASASSINATLKFLKNGNPYDDTLGFLKIGANIVPTFVPIFALYNAGDIGEIQMLNESGTNKDYGIYAFGWDFQSF